uniref:PDZ domain-containing protein n=1 Tax=Hanusia phi TaxID=3032 RepID=A0A7S0I3G7_9CRYP|mmetsp:Transcript_9156/g.21001  ORF Transcript_9156/g.21001 Transcript_9156/m.21001 type:complete len:593 (+) Transcript_9156:71-1849(+)
MLKRLFKSSPKSSPTSSPSDSSLEIEDSANASADQAGIGIVFQIAPDGGFYIKSMEVGGSADECGLLEEGDCLMSVNSRKAFGVPPDVVTRLIIGQVGTPISTKFRRNVVLDNGTCEFQYFSPVLTRGKTAELPKPAGVGIIFRVGSDKGMYVKSLAPDGPASQSKQVFLDDCLMSVDRKEVYGKPVTDVTPLLTGAFGSQVELGFRAPAEKRVRYVNLIRGKKATFLDDALKKRKKQDKCISVMVPDDAEPLDYLEATDEKGRLLRIQVPLGAVPGTLLRVPIPVDTSRASSDEKLLQSMLEELQAVQGSEDVFMWKGKLLRRPKKNADGSITIVEDETGEAIWHGFFGTPPEEETVEPAVQTRETSAEAKQKEAERLERENERKRKEEEEVRRQQERIERKKREEAAKEAERLKVSLRDSLSAVAMPQDSEAPLSPSPLTPANHPAGGQASSPQTLAVVSVEPVSFASNSPPTPQELAMVPHSIADLQVSNYPAASPPSSFLEASGSLARVDSSRLTALQSGVAPGLQVLSSARVVSDMANRVAKNLAGKLLEMQVQPTKEGPEEKSSISYENLKPVKLVIDRFEKLLAL